jgi:hypothetical protein
VATLTTLDDTLRAWGFDVTDHNLTGRPGKFDCQGVMGHHTAGPSGSSSRTPSLNVIRNGRTGIPGPLSQLYIGYDALDDLAAGRKPTIHLCSRGRSNHAGTGGPWRIVPEDSGNAYLAGIETENVGNQCLAPLMLMLERRAAAATLDHINKDASWYTLHKEYAGPRKPDIACVTATAERVAIQKILNTGPGVLDVALTSAEIDAIWNEQHTIEKGAFGNNEKTSAQMRNWLALANLKAGNAAKAAEAANTGVSQIKAKLTAVEEKVDRLSGGSIDYERIQQMITTSIANAFKSLEIESKD